MKYYEVIFSIACSDELMAASRDVLMALAGEAGLESFVETDAGITGYVQRQLLCTERLDALTHDFPIEGVSIGYVCGEAEEHDWNEPWEQEGFEPIVVSGRLVVHDGRHLPPAATACGLTMVEIDARMAFGTGTHETTRLMLAALLGSGLRDKRVLDCGCGTGILGIAALKAGARETVGYDIDEWSTDNTRHNAVINGCDEHYQVLLGDSSVLEQVEGTFDVVMANINRNILLADMHHFAAKMRPGGKLLISGFYAADKPLLEEKAHSLRLTTEAESSEGDWVCLVFNSTKEQQ